MAAKAVKLNTKLLGRERKRAWEIDFLRGLCIILVVFDHAMLNFWFLMPNMATNWNAVGNPFFEWMRDFGHLYWHHRNIRNVVRFSVVFLFLFLSGVSSSFTRSNAERVRKLAGAAALITFVTVIMEGITNAGVIITFGILHILCLSLLIYMLAKKIFPHRNFYLFLGAAIFIGGLFIPIGGGRTMPFWEVFATQHIWQLNFSGFVSQVIGTGIYGADSYGILPYAGFFLLGAAAGEVLYKNKRSLLPALDGRWNKAFCFVGRRAIWVYLAHQVIILAAIILGAMAVGYEFF